MVVSLVSNSDSDPAAAGRPVSPRRHRGHGDFTEQRPPAATKKESHRRDAEPRGGRPWERRLPGRLEYPTLVALCGTLLRRTQENPSLVAKDFRLNTSVHKYGNLESAYLANASV